MCSECATEIHAAAISVDKAVWEHAQQQSDWAVDLCAECWHNYEELWHKEW